MSAHNHPEFVEGCYRCDLSRDEAAEGVGYSVGAWARLEAMRAGDRDWMNVTRWPRAKEVTPEALERIVGNPLKEQE